MVRWRNSSCFSAVLYANPHGHPFLERRLQIFFLGRQNTGRKKKKKASLSVPTIKCSNSCCNDSCRISVIDLDLLIKFLILILYSNALGACHFFIQVRNTQAPLPGSPYLVTACCYFGIYECFFYSAILFCKEMLPLFGGHSGDFQIQIRLVQYKVFRKDVCPFLRTGRLSVDSAV